MASFGLNTAADFLQKLREERRDFVASQCLDPRHAINAVMTAYHLVEWVFGENAGRPGFEYENYKLFRRSLSAVVGKLIEDAGLITDGTKHFLPEKIDTGKHKDPWGRTWGNAWGKAWGDSYLWLDRDAGRQRAEDFIDELVAFWDSFFRKHSLKQYAEAVGISGQPRCGCGTPLRQFDARGVHLTGCERCNLWWPLAKPPIRLSPEDLRAIRTREPQ